MCVIPKVRALCRHCGSTPISRPRGLCWSCYYCPSNIREKYGPISPHGNRGLGLKNPLAPRPLPAEPIHAYPGSEEKVRILCERAERGEALHHPLDLRADRPAPWMLRQHKFHGGGHLVG